MMGVHRRGQALGDPAGPGSEGQVEGILPHTSSSRWRSPSHHGPPICLHADCAFSPPIPVHVGTTLLCCDLDAPKPPPQGLDGETQEKPLVPQLLLDIAEGSEGR